MGDQQKLVSMISEGDEFNNKIDKNKKSYDIQVQ